MSNNIDSDRNEKFAIEKIECTIQGKSPLLTHNPRGMDVFDPLVKELASLTSKRNKTEDDLLRIQKLEIKIALYYDEDQGPFCPGYAMKSCIASGATNWRKGSTIKKGFEIEEEKLPLAYEGPRDLETLSSDPKYRYATRVVVGQSAIVRTRPKFDDWMLSFHAQYLLGEFNFDQISDFIEFAGLYRGLLDARILGFGRFKIVELNKVNGNMKLKARK